MRTREEGILMATYSNLRRTSDSPAEKSSTDDRPAETAAEPSTILPIPGLILGNRQPPAPGPHRPLTISRLVLRRNQQSAEQLATMARPKAYDGPDLNLRADIVNKLEPLLNQLNQTDPLKRQPCLYLGSVVLDKLPESDDTLADWIGSHQTEATEFSILKQADATRLTTQASIGNDLAQYTLKVMQTTGQIDYLRTSGFVGEDWSIIVEMHYYRDRPRKNPVLHKDTLGQTLFVNLDYFNSDPDAGPEFIVNPPPIQSHENKMATTLPEEFREDLSEVRKNLKTPTEIETLDLQPNQVIAFVDELIHHATPLAGNRTVTIANLKTFLTQDPDFKNVDWTSTETTSANTETSDQAAEQWQTLKHLCASGKKKTSRPELRQAGMNDDQIDRLLDKHAKQNYNWVHIDKNALTDTNTHIVLTKPSDNESESDEPLKLKRTMSYRDTSAIQKTADKKRSFLRTWIRAVPPYAFTRRKI